MKRFGWSGKDSEKEAPATEDSKAAAADESSDLSNNSAAGDTVPQLPNISRNSVASIRSSTGPQTPHRNSTGIGSEANGSAPPTLVKVPFPIQHRLLITQDPGLLLKGQSLMNVCANL